MIKKLVFTRSDSPQVTHIIDTEGKLRLAMGCPAQEEVRVWVDQAPLSPLGYENMVMLESAVLCLHPYPEIIYEDGMHEEPARFPDIQGGQRWTVWA